MLHVLDIKKTVGAPVLIALLVGKAARDGEHMSSQDHVDHAIIVLRKLFGRHLFLIQLGQW